VLDWLRLWLPRAITGQDWTSERTGQTALFGWRLYAANDARLLLSENAGPEAPGATDLEAELDPLGLFKLRERLLWQYPHAAAAREPAVKRVSELVRGAAAGEETQSLFPDSSLAALKPVARAVARKSKLAPAETGSAHHRFLELVSLEHVTRLDDLKAEAKDLQASGWLTGPELNALDLEGILDFWTSETGRKILSQLSCVQREIPFTARFTPDDLAALGLCANASDLAGEYFVARGKADLAVLLPEEIWLLDFKTDRLKEPALTESIQRYSRQLKLYALGLCRIYRRPVTARWLHFLSLRHTVAV
jgi:ATP-dependent helicase/nuclease subunit A